MRRKRKGWEEGCGCDEEGWGWGRRRRIRRRWGEKEEVTIETPTLARQVPHTSTRSTPSTLTHTQHQKGHARYSFIPDKAYRQEQQERRALSLSRHRLPQTSSGPTEAWPSASVRPSSFPRSRTTRAPPFPTTTPSSTRDQHLPPASAPPRDKGGRGTGGTAGRAGGGKSGAGGWGARSWWWGGENWEEGRLRPVVPCRRRGAVHVRLRLCGV